MVWPWQAVFAGSLVAGAASAALCFGLGDSVEPVDWRTAFTTAWSPRLNPTSLWYVRVATASALAAILAWSVVAEAEAGRLRWWPIFLTHWVLSLQLLFAVLLAVVAQPSKMALYDLIPMGAADVRGEAPRSLRALTVLFSIQLPASIMVVAMYWGMDLPFWELCALGAKAPCRTIPTVRTFFIHGVNSLLVCIGFGLGSIPFCLKNGGWFICFATTYAVWTYIHHLLRMGTGKGCGEGIPLGDCPIYAGLNWNKPEVTAKMTAVTLLMGCPSVVICCGLLSIARYFFCMSSKHQPGPTCS